MRMREMDEETALKGTQKHNSKAEMNTTPIRLREVRPLKENIQTIGKDVSLQGKENNLLISNSNDIEPKNRPKTPVGSKQCANHLESQAQFKILIDTEVFFYCKKCAAHLASNGFEVEKLPSRSPHRTRVLSAAFKSPQNNRKQQLSTFLTALKCLHEGFTQRQDSMGRTVSAFETEKITINNVYASMIEYIEYIREEHLRYFIDNSERTAETCRVAMAEIGEAIEEITEIKVDIEDNFDKIVSRELDDNSYLECMQFYRQKHGLLEQRLEDLEGQTPEIACTTVEAVDQKLGQFKEFFDELIGLHNQKQ